MKRMKILSMVLVTSLMSGSIVLLSSCQKNEFESPKQEEIASPEVESLMATIFDEVYTDAIITGSVCPDGSVIINETDLDLASIQFQMTKSATTEETNPWKKWGLVSGIGSANKFYKEMKSTYGNQTYEIKVEAELDSKGNPTGNKIMYHRPSEK